jgi:hypothetical protein
MKVITLNSRVRLNADLHTMEVDEATIVADGGGSDCYGLELIARRIWQLLPRAGSVAELCETLLKEYDVDRETCELGVLEFLNESMREGLIRTAD